MHLPTVTIGISSMERRDERGRHFLSLFLATMYFRVKNHVHRVICGLSFKPFFSDSFFFQHKSFKSVHSASKFTFFGQSFLLLMWLMKKDSMAFNAFLTLPHPLDKTLEFSTVHRYMYRCSTFVQELHNIVEMFSKFE